VALKARDWKLIAAIAFLMWSGPIFWALSVWLSQ
jgi:hypothetical protein